MGGGVLRDLSSDDRKALRTLHQERFSRAFKAAFLGENRNLNRNPETAGSDAADASGEKIE